MTKPQKFFLFLSRVLVGWYMFYAGLTKVLDPAWTSKGYLLGAKTFGGFYLWLASPANIGWVDFVNKWGLTFLGVSLILGIGVRFSSVLGALLMMLYYFPVLTFPYVGRSLMVDDHVIYALFLLVFASLRAGRAVGLENWCANLPICSKYPGLHKWWG